jgi:hypothetical protein
VTARETIVLAVYQLTEQYPGRHIHLSDIVLEAWKLDTIRFGLPGWTGKHPCSRRVSMELTKMQVGGYYESTGNHAASVRITEPCYYVLTVNGVTEGKKLSGIKID